MSKVLSDDRNGQPNDDKSKRQKKIKGKQLDVRSTQIGTIEIRTIKQRKRKNQHKNKYQSDVILKNSIINIF